MISVFMFAVVGLLSGVVAAWLVPLLMARLARQWQENTAAALEAPEPYWQAAHLTWRAMLALSGIMILVSLSVYWRYGIGIQGGVALLIFAVLVLAAEIDRRIMLLPDVLTLPLVWAGLILNMNGMFVSLDASVIGATVGYLLLKGVQMGYWLVARKGAVLGDGDAKLAATLGACFGAEVVIITLFFASVILVGWRCGRKEGREVPFGPAIVGAALVGMAFDGGVLG